MANEVRRRTNNVQGQLSAALTSTSTTMTSAGLVNLEAISSTEHAAINIDPGRSAGAPEIVYVTAHSAASTSANILRAQEDTAARAHSTGVTWLHAPTAAVDYLPYRPPSAGVRRDAAQSIGTGTWTAVQFDTERWDTDSMWSSTDSERANVNTAGKYLVTFGSAILGSSAGNRRGVGIVKNSTTIATNAEDSYRSQIDSTAIGDEYIGAVSGMFELTTSDFVSGVLFQDSGVSVNTSTTLSLQPKFSITWQSS